MRDDYEWLRKMNDDTKEKLHDLEDYINKKEQEWMHKEEMHNLQKSQWEQNQKDYDRKISQLDEAVKAKSKQLVDIINRDRGGHYCSR